MILLLKFVLFAILKNVLTIFLINIEHVNSVILKMFWNDFMIKKDLILQKQRDRCARFRDLQTRLKEFEEKFGINDSENH